MAKSVAVRHCAGPVPRAEAASRRTRISCTVRARFPFGPTSTSNDTFWFSFFHEVGHVLKHQSRRAVYLDDASSGDHTTSPDELEANRFASDVLMPPELVSELNQLALTEASVKAWAAQVGLHPGIVVGQLQHRKRLPWAHPLTKLKARYDIQTKP